MTSASIVVVNQRTEIERLSRFVEQFGARHHLSIDDILDANLVLDEVVINVIAHGYDDDREHEIRVSLAIDGNLLTIQIEDDGRAFDAASQPSPNLDLPVDERRIGGLGIHIVRSITETIEHQRIDGRNVLTLTKRVSPA
jgi:serine/threonine-protein kinase RsbW